MRDVSQRYSNALVTLIVQLVFASSALRVKAHGRMFRLPILLQLSDVGAELPCCIRPAILLFQAGRLAIAEATLATQ